VGGSFSGTVDFDPGPKTKYVSSGVGCCGVPNEAGFVLKLNSNGTFGWVSPFVGQVQGGTKGYAVTHSVALDNAGNVFAGGFYAGGPVDFNPGSGITTLPGTGGFITKLNSSGGLVWARGLEAASGSLSARGLAVDAAGAVYATGYFTGTADFDPGAATYVRTAVPGGTNIDLQDIFVVKLTSAGNFAWAETFGSDTHDSGFGIAVDSGGDVHVAGRYSGTVDFDPDPLEEYTLTASGTLRSGFKLRLRQV
jgi:hypothetical protein